MPIDNFDIVGSYNNQRFPSVDAERTINLFEYLDPKTKKGKTLLPTSGLSDAGLDFGSTTGGFRTSFLFGTDTYHVIGSNIYKVNNSGPNNSLTQTLINPATPLGTTSGYVGVDANTFQIIFVDGVHGYIYDTAANLFTQITDASFPTNPIDVCALDNFFVVGSGGTPNFLLSTLNQGLQWGAAANNFTTNHVVNNNLTIGASTLTGGVSGAANYQTGLPVTLTNSGGALPTPLQLSTTYYTIYVDSTHIQLATTYANAIAGTAITITGDGSGTQTITSSGQLQQASITTHPGNIVACRTLHRRLFLFSNFFTEVWENQGIGTNLPFRRNNSLLMEYGTDAVGSISVGFDKMFFLSRDREGLGPVMMVTGTESIPISNKALDAQFQTYAASTGISDCRSFVVRERGLIFYRMNFTASNATYVYNVTMSNPAVEEERRWHEEQTLNGSRHPAQTHVYLNGNNYVGHYNTAILYQLSASFYSNDGEWIPRIRIPRPFVPPGYQRIRVDRFQIDCVQGNTQEDVYEIQDLIIESGLNTIQSENGDDLLTDQTFAVYNSYTPYIFMLISKDGGQTWPIQLKAPMGLEGDRTFRTVFRKLPTTKRGQSFQIQIKFFNPMPFVVMGAAWHYEVLPE